MTDDHLIYLIASSADALISAVRGLIFPTIVFAGLALIIRKKEVLSDIRRIAPEVRLTLAIMAFNVVFIVPVIAVGSTALTAVFRTYDLALVSGDFWDTIPLPLTLVIAVVIGDFIGYWRHRLEHHRVLWPSHAVHHSDTQMTWLTLQRFHPINRLTTFAVDGCALLLLGMPPSAVVANGLVRHYYGYFIHADLPWTYGRLGRIFVSPAMHRWHHAMDVEAFETNFATVFSVFDRMFGTFRVPGPCTVSLGATDRMTPSLAGQLAYPFLPRAYRRPTTITSDSDH
ncbi:MAG: sterol desaturase family protein [Inquilinaceae bacterium]